MTQLTLFPPMPTRVVRVSASSAAEARRAAREACAGFYGFIRIEWFNGDRFRCLSFKCENGEDETPRPEAAWGAERPKRPSAWTRIIADANIQLEDLA